MARGRSRKRGGGRGRGRRQRNDGADEVNREGVDVGGAVVNDNVNVNLPPVVFDLNLVKNEPVDNDDLGCGGLLSIKQEPVEEGSGAGLVDKLETKLDTESTKKQPRRRNIPSTLTLEPTRKSSRISERLSQRSSEPPPRPLSPPKRQRIARRPRDPPPRSPSPPKRQCLSQRSSDPPSRPPSPPKRQCHSNLTVYESPRSFFSETVEDWKYCGRPVRTDLGESDAQNRYRNQLWYEIKALSRKMIDLQVEDESTDPDDLVKRLKFKVSSYASKLNRAGVGVRHFATIRVTAQQNADTYFVFTLDNRDLAEDLGISVQTLRNACERVFQTVVLRCENKDGDTNYLDPDKYLDDLMADCNALEMPMPEA